MVLTERKEKEAGAAAAVGEAARPSSGKPQVTLREEYTVAFLQIFVPKKNPSLWPRKLISNSIESLEKLTKLRLCSLTAITCKKF